MATWQLGIGDTIAKLQGLLSRSAVPTSDDVTACEHTQEGEKAQKQENVTTYKQQTAFVSEAKGETPVDGKHDEAVEDEVNARDLSKR